MLLKKTPDDGYEYVKYQKSFDDNVIAPIRSEQLTCIPGIEVTNGMEASEISYSVEVFDDFLTSGFAAILAVFAREMDFFMAFKSYMNVDMKSVDFTVQNKLEVLILAICMGCCIPGI